MTLQKIVIEVGGKTDLKSTIDQLVKLGVIDKNNAKQFLENSKKTQEATDQNSKKLGGFEKALTKIGPVLAGAFAVSKIIDFGKAVIDITAKFQKFEAVLTNTLGSKSEAQRALAQIKKFASETPFSVSELTDSFVKLANQGFKPTKDEMRKLGDLAASTGKSFDQLTEGIIDAQTGEFERLKEFGIRASKEGDNVKFTFKGVETQTKFTSQAIREYILSLGDAVGVSGSMAAISETVGGKISNLGDSWDSLLQTIGDGNSGVLATSIDLLADLVKGMELALMTDEQLKKKLDNMELQSNIDWQADKIEKDAKELSKIMDIDEARALVMRDKLIWYIDNLAIERGRLEKHTKLFGNNLSDEQVQILKGMKDNITFYEEMIKTLDESLTALDKKEQDRIKAEKDAEKKRLEDEEKARKEREKRRQEALKRELDALKNKYIEEENVEKRNFINKEINEEELEKRLKSIREKYRKDEIAVLQKYGDSTVEIQKQILDEQVQDRKNAEKEKLDAIRKTYDSEAQFMKDQAEKMKKLGEENQKIANSEGEGRKKQKDERIAAEQQVFDFTLSSINQINSAIVESSRIRTDAAIKNLSDQSEKEISALDKRRDAGLISEGKYQAQKQVILNKQAQQEAALRRKQAQQEKQAALFQIGVNTAAAVLKGIAQFGPPPSPPGVAAIATALATGALQAALVASRPLPAFKKGVVDLQGPGTSTSDSILARLSKGESVIPAEATRKHKADIQAMIDGTYSKYTMPVINKKSLAEARQESMAENIYKSLNLQGQFNDGRIVNAIRDTKRGKKEDEKLAGMIASKISDRLSENNLYA